MIYLSLPLYMVAFCFNNREMQILGILIRELNRKTRIPGNQAQFEAFSFRAEFINMAAWYNWKTKGTCVKSAAATIPLSKE